MNKILFSFVALSCFSKISCPPTESETYKNILSLMLFNARGTADYYLNMETTILKNEKNSTYLAFFAHHPNTKEEDFNEQKSLSKKSLFIGRVTPIAEQENITLNGITYQPVVLFNTYTNNYETGYEVYLDPNLSTETNISTLVGSNRLIYTRADRSRTKTDNTFTFIWANVLSIRIDSTTYTPLQIESTYPISKTKVTAPCFDFTAGKKAYMGLDVKSLYGEANQKGMFKQFQLPSSHTGMMTRKRKQSFPCGQQHGCLIPQPLVPPEYFHSSSVSKATCSYLNTIPMWNALVWWWHEIERFIFIVNQSLKNMRIITGTADTLSFVTTKLESQVEPMFLNKKDKISVPGIVYKLIEYEILSHTFTDPWYYVMVIILQNDPTTSELKNPICEKSICMKNGWIIENDNSTTGITYCCPLDEQTRERLGLEYNRLRSVKGVLNLNKIPMLRDGNKITERLNIARTVANQWR